MENKYHKNADILPSTSRHDMKLMMYRYVRVNHESPRDWSVHVLLISTDCLEIEKWLVISYYSITVTSYWAGWCLKSPPSPLFAQLLVQAQIKENIKAPRHWSLCGEFFGDRWNSPHKGPVTGKCFHLMTSTRRNEKHLRFGIWCGSY